MTAWYEGPLCGFDLETTGTDPETARIVTACVAELNGDEPGAVNWLADPGIEIPAEVTAIHGISTEHARAHGRPTAVVVEEVIAELAAQAAGGTPLVIMNAPYDLTLLDREARRHGLKTLTDIVGGELLVIDPKILDKEVSPRRGGKRKLTDLCRRYGVTLDGAHSADADAVAACRVARVLGARYRRLGRMSARELHAAQVGWAEQQAVELAAYFRRTPGKEEWADGVRTEWPLVPAPRGGEDQ